MHLLRSLQRAHACYVRFVAHLGGGIFEKLDLQIVAPLHAREPAQGLGRVRDGILPFVSISRLRGGDVTVKVIECLHIHTHNNRAGFMWSRAVGHEQYECKETCVVQVPARENCGRESQRSGEKATFV